MKMNFLKLATLTLSLSVAFVFCSKSSDSSATTTPLPTSDSIAPANLVAKFSFENAITDAKGNITGGTNTNATFGTGKKGYCLTTNGSQYVTYSTVGTAITGLKSYAVSVWINTDTTTQGAQTVFLFNGNADWNGQLTMIKDNASNASTPYDSLLIKGLFSTYVSSAFSTQDVVGMSDTVVGSSIYTFKRSAMARTWKHIVMQYDAASSSVSIYVNGVKVKIPSAWALRTNNGTPIGSLALTQITKFVLAGTNAVLGETGQSWNKNYKGSIDELRIYNRALTDVEISNLYSYELSGN